MRGRGASRVEWRGPKFNEEDEIMEVVKIPTIYTLGLNGDSWHEGVLVPPTFFFLFS